MQFLLLEKSHAKQKVRTQFLLFKNPNKHGKEKGKNSILTFEKKVT